MCIINRLKKKEKNEVPTKQYIQNVELSKDLI